MLRLVCTRDPMPLSKENLPSYQEVKTRDLVHQNTRFDHWIMVGKREMNVNAKDLNLICKKYLLEFLYD